MIARLFIVGVLGLAMAACASRPEPEKLAASWVGYPVGQLIDSWGTPDKIEPAAGGGSIYSWRAERRYVQPLQCGSTGIRSVGPCTGGYVQVYSCDFDADAEGQILSASGRGDCLPLRSLTAPQS